MTGYILAGGLSSRFGSDKALYQVEGKLLLLRLSELVAQAGLKPVVVARHLRPEVREVPHLLEPEHPTRHPLFGVACALAQTEEPFALVLSCDLVDLQLEHLKILLAEPPPVATAQLLAVLPASDAALALQLASSGAPVRTLLSRYRTLELGFLCNLNTPP
jgi:molybdopterin-guanine dinucleotide biosynthesis protein A